MGTPPTRRRRRPSSSSRGPARARSRARRLPQPHDVVGRLDDDRGRARRGRDAPRASTCLCVTDHHAIDGARRLRDVLPCRVIVGEEVRSTQGEIIGLFLEERVPFGLTPQETAKRIREQGGLVYIPHPVRPDAPQPRRDRARVARGRRTRRRDRGSQREDVARVAEPARVPSSPLRTTSPPAPGSDAHVPDAIGSAYVEIADFDDAAFVPRRAARRHRRRPPLRPTPPVAAPHRPLGLAHRLTNSG